MKKSEMSKSEKTETYFLRAEASDENLQTNRCAEALMAVEASKQNNSND